MAGRSSICILLLCLGFVSVVAAAGAQSPERGTPGYCISGTVLSGTRPGVAVSDASVMLESSGNSRSSRTSPGGFFVFCGVPRGSLTIQVSAPGYQFTQMEFLADPDQLNEIRIALQPLHEDDRPAGQARTVSAASLAVPSRARDEFNRFLKYAGEKNWEKSLDSLRKATEIYPRYTDAWTNMGIIFTRLNKPGQAEEAFARALDLEPKSPVIRRKLGYLYLETRRWDEARRELEISESLDGSDARTQAYLGHALNHLGRAPEAERHLQRALELQPDMPFALFALACSQIQLNQPDRALQTFERFMDRNDGSASAVEVREIMSRIRALHGG
jgi:Tfp pilus assembly protein PilF